MKKAFIFLVAALTLSVSPALASVAGDANNDGKVDGLDYVIWLTNYGTPGISGPSVGDFNSDSNVDGIDYVTWLTNYGIEPTPTPIPVTVTVTVTPTPTPSPVPVISGEWTQHAHDAQRTSYTDQVVNTPWRWKWSWNGPNATGGISAGKTGLPRNVQPVTGGGRVYVAAGSRGVFALNNTNGSVIWNAANVGTVNSTVAYDSESVFVVSTNGTLYKLNAGTGAISGQFSSTSGTSTLPLPPAVISDRILFSMGTAAYAINKTTMAQIWKYDAGSPVDSPPAYSPSRNRVIIATRDLFAHAITNTNGAQAWRVRLPTPRTPGNPGSDTNFAEVSKGWPVLAEVHGLVLIKLRLDWQALWDYGGPWPTDNATTRSWLQSPSGQDDQALMVLDIDDGSSPFVANIGHGGMGDGGYEPMGPQPVVKRFSDNTELVYTVIRGGSRVAVPDGRADSHLGEMVLDSTTVAGLQPGYVRWIQYPSSNQQLTTDEQPNVSMAGNYLYFGHWMASTAALIGNRSSSLGSFSNPIGSTNQPAIISSQDPSSCAFSSSHYCPDGLGQQGDWKPWMLNNGYYIYYNQGKPFDTYWNEWATWSVSNSTIYYLSTDGAVTALENGNP